MGFTVLQIFKKFGFLLVSLWMTHLSMGVTMAIVGPSLPYLGLNVGQNMTIVSFLYTARAIGFVLLSIVTGMVFRRLHDGWKKMVWISSGLILMSIAVIAIPFINNIGLLLGVLFTYGGATGMVDTADNSLVIYLLGQKDSRPIVQSLHFTVATGAFLAPFVIRPFLIQIGQSNSTQDVCSGNDANETESAETGDTPLEGKTLSDLASSPLVWPYVIVTCISIVATLMFLSLAIIRPRLSQYREDIRQDSLDVAHLKAKGRRRRHPALRKNRSMVSKIILITLFILFFFFHCGTENTFWSHLYSFGMCSALKMSPGDAALLSMAFFGGFLAGRGSGMFISRYVRPTYIIIAGSSGCLLTTTTLAIWGEAYAAVAMVCAVVYGYSISMLFGSGISWLAQHIDVTGTISSTWFIGAYLGISAIPPLAGMFFDLSIGAIGVMYLVTGTTVAAFIIFAGLNVFVKFF